MGPGIPKPGGMRSFDSSVQLFVRSPVYEYDGAFRLNAPKSDTHHLPMKKILIATVIASTLSLFAAAPQAQAGTCGKHHHKHHHHHHHTAA